MSTRMYNLRMRTPRTVKPIPIHSHIPVTREAVPRTKDAQPKSGAAVDMRSYSEVVALRPPSPQELKETMSSPAEELSHVLKDGPAVRKADSGSSDESPSSDSPKDRENSGWTTVKHQRACSLSSLNRIKRNSMEITPAATFLLLSRRIL